MERSTPLSAQTAPRVARHSRRETRARFLASNRAPHRSIASAVPIPFTATLGSDPETSEQANVRHSTPTVRAGNDLVRDKNGTVRAENGPVRAKDGFVRGGNGFVRGEDGLVRGGNGAVRRKDGPMRGKNGSVRDKNGASYRTFGLV